MKKALEFTFFALLAGFILLAAQQTIPFAQGGVQGDPVAGGRLYDNWMLALDQPPAQGNHPLWDDQDSNTRRGVVTWRCAECHGWDYKGVDGAYGPYSNHYTGFTGLENTVGASHEQVIDWLDGTNNADHNFLAYTNTTALDDLAAFLRTRQIDADLLIDPSTGAALGERTAGRGLYLSTCAECHGSNGDLINFGTTIDPLYLGDLAVADPWQTVHKMRFGTATTSRMPAVEDLDWSLSMVADTLAYMQTLPRGNPDFFTINPDPAEVVAVETQAEIEPLVWATFAIVGIVAISVGWDYFAKRRSGIPS